MKRRFILNSKNYLTICQISFQTVYGRRLQNTRIPRERRRPRRATILRMMMLAMRVMILTMMPLALALLVLFLRLLLRRVNQVKNRRRN